MSEILLDCSSEELLEIKVRTANGEDSALCFVKDGHLNIELKGLCKVRLGRRKDEDRATEGVGT